MLQHDNSSAGQIPQSCCFLVIWQKINPLFYQDQHMFARVPTYINVYKYHANCGAFGMCSLKKSAVLKNMNEK